MVKSQVFRLELGFESVEALENRYPGLLDDVLGGRAGSDVVARHPQHRALVLLHQLGEGPRIAGAKSLEQLGLIHAAQRIGGGM
jgi:hypothetical protein